VVTIRDVAVNAGVSPATVSRVVNGLLGYSDETPERAETAVKGLSYETDCLAWGLKTRQTSAIRLRLAPGRGRLAAAEQRRVGAAHRHLPGKDGRLQP